MTDPQPAPPNVAALVDAIDARAKQAGSEGANEVMQRMLGSVSDVLAGIADRLDHVEELLGDDGPTRGTGGGGNAVVEAVQAGLASFNARLGRLEEAFVQAVDDNGSGTQSVVDEVRTVVTKALEEAVPAGKKAPALDPETKAALARVESALGALAEGASSAKPVEDAVSLALSAVGDRLDGLEARLVTALESQVPAEAKADLSTLDLTEQLTPVLDRLDYLERRLMESQKAGTGTTVEDAFELVQVRIAGLEQLVRTRASERQDSAAEVRAAIAPAMERLQGVETALRASKDQVARVDANVASIPGKFSSLEERVWAVVSTLSEGTGRGVDPTLLTRLEEAVERLDRDEQSARLVRLVEERLSAGLRAVTERTDEVRRALEAFVASAATTVNASSAGADEVKSRVDALRTEVRSLTSLPDSVSTALAARLGPLADRVGGLDARLDGIDARVSGIDDTVGQLHTSLDSIAAMRLRLDEVAARPAPDVGVLTELRSRMDELSAIQSRLGELSGVVPLLDELVAAGAKQDTSSDDDVTAAIAALSASLESRLEPLASNEEVTEAIASLRRELERRLDALASAPPPEVTVIGSGANDPETRAAIVALTTSLADRFEALDQRISPASTATLEDLVRKETELLTQRVAALAVGVEATRALLEQQQVDAENRIGRKAGEVTRRLAADFGIRTGRSGPGSRGRRDPRELGPPTGDRSS